MNSPTKQEYEPGYPAPETGRYHLINVFGRDTGDSVVVEKEQTLPPAPRGFRRIWRPLTEP